MGLFIKSTSSSLASSYSRRYQEVFIPKLYILVINYKNKIELLFCLPLYCLTKILTEGFRVLFSTLPENLKTIEEVLYTKTVTSYEKDLLIALER